MLARLETAFNPSIASLGNHSFLHTHRHVCLAHIIYVRDRSEHNMQETGIQIQTRMCFYTEVLLLPFFVGFISRSRSLIGSFIKRGAKIMATSTVAPRQMTKPCAYTKA